MSVTHHGFHEVMRQENVSFTTYVTEDKDKNLVPAIEIRADNWSEKMVVKLKGHEARTLGESLIHLADRYSGKTR